MLLNMCRLNMIILKKLMQFGILNKIQQTPNDIIELFKTLEL